MNSQDQLNQIDDEARADFDAFARGLLTFEEAWGRANRRKQQKAVAWLLFKREWRQTLATIGGEIKQQGQTAGLVAGDGN